MWRTSTRRKQGSRRVEACPKQNRNRPTPQPGLSQAWGQGQVLPSTSWKPPLPHALHPPSHCSWKLKELGRMFMWPEQMPVFGSHHPQEDPVLLADRI